MKIYTRYLLKNLLLPVFFITVTLTSVAWLTQSLKFIDMIVNNGLPISTFLYFIMLLLPSLLMIVLPIAIFCACIYVYNKLLYESEILVLKAAGISRLAIAKPAVILGVAATLISYSISLYFLPISFREFRDLQFYLRDNYASLMLQEGVFNNAADGLMVYVKDKKSDGTLEGILVHDNRVPEKPVTMMAESGTLQRGEKGLRFLLQNASRQEVNRTRGEVNILYFDSFPLDITLYTGVDLTRTRKKDERFLSELLHPEQGVPEKMRKKFIAEAHHRLVWPLFNLALPLMTIALLFTGDFNRRGASDKIIKGSALAIGTIMFWFSMKAIAGGGSAVGIVMMYLPALIIIIWSLKLLAFPKLKIKQRRAS